MAESGRGDSRAQRDSFHEQIRASIGKKRGREGSDFESKPQFVSVTSTSDGGVRRKGSQSSIIRQRAAPVNQAKAAAPSRCCLLV